MESWIANCNPFLNFQSESPVELQCIQRGRTPFRISTKALMMEDRICMLYRIMSACAWGWRRSQCKWVVTQRHRGTRPVNDTPSVAADCGVAPSSQAEKQHWREMWYCEIVNLKKKVRPSRQPGHWLPLLL